MSDIVRPSFFMVELPVSNQNHHGNVLNHYFGIRFDIFFLMYKLGIFPINMVFFSYKYGIFFL